MPAGHTKFNASWLSCVDINNQTVSEWCRKGKDSYHAYCRFCDSDIKCDNSGKAQLLQHAKKEKHKQAIKSACNSSKAKLLITTGVPSTSSSSGSRTSSGANVVSFNYDDASLTSKIYWLAKMASCNFSLRSADHIGDTFKEMFPDSKIAAGFSLSRTSASYMIGEGLAPYFKTVIIEDLKKSNLPFTMHFDETSTAQVKKQMDLTLRYWSPTHNEVWVAYSTSLFFGHAEGVKVASRMFNQMKDDEIPMGKLIALARDGPNVNKTILNKLQQMIKADDPQFVGFVDLGSCVLHIVHNAFGKGLEKYGKEVDQLCLDVHAIFKHSAARREDYQQLQFDMGVDLHTFQQHTEVCWLTIGPAVSRIIEQWDAICQFIKDLGKNEKTPPKSINYKRVAAMLTGVEKDVTKVLLEFLRNVFPLFEEFLTLFQKSSPTIHLVYDSMCLTLLKVMRRFLKPTALEGKYGATLGSVSCVDVKLQLGDNELVIGDQTRQALACLNPAKQRLAILGIRAFYVAAVSHLQSRLPLDNKLLRDLGCLNPLKRDRKSTVASIQNLTKKLQPQLDVSSLLDEWKLLQADPEVSEIDTNQQVDHYWNAVFQLKSFDGSSRYESLPSVIKSGLVLAQTNAESERSLSINARVVTSERSLLGEVTITGLRTVKEAVRFYDPVNSQPEKIAITRDLKRSVRSAHTSYQARLEAEKLEKERKKEEAEEKKKEAERVQKAKEDMAKSRQSLQESEHTLMHQEEVVQADLKAADELLSDATSKLHETLSATAINKQSVNVATMMLETAKTKRDQAMQSLQKIGRKRKLLTVKQHRLLEKALSSTADTAQKKSKAKKAKT